MNRITSEKKCMYDLMVELKILKKCSSGIYMLMPHGMDIYWKFQMMFYNIINEQLQISIIDMPLLIPYATCPSEIIDSYKELFFTTSDRKGKKYLLTSDINIFSQQLKPILSENAILCLNVRFRNNYEGSDSKKRLFQYHSCELIFDYNRDWKKIKNVLMHLSSKTGLKMFLKKKNREATEYNICVFCTQTLYKCNKCKKMYLFNERCCCGDINKVNKQVYYAIGHIQIYEDIAYLGFSFENLLGAICENMQYGGWGIFPAELEKRKIVITNLSNKYCIDIFNFFKANNYDILYENKRVISYKESNYLVFGFDEKALKVLIYDGYTSRFNKLSEGEIEEILSLWLK